MYETNILETNKQLQDIAINTEDTAEALIDGSQRSLIITPGDVPVTGTVNLGQNSLNVNITGGTISVINTNASVAPTGGPVPGSATYVGYRNGSGNLTPITIGQQAMADSLPVAIASDQSPIPISGTVTITDPSVSLVGNPVPTYAQYIGFRSSTGNLTPVILTVAGSLPVDGSATIQPVSQSGTWNINNISGTISLPTGASTSANQTNKAQYTRITDGTNDASVTAANALKVDGSAVTQPISGTVSISGTVPISGTITANQGTSPWVTNVSQFGGSAVVTGTGTSGAGIPRVTVSNDSNILATQSGSWTVTANAGTNLNTSALALNTTVAALQVSQGSTTSGQQGTLTLGAVTTAAPTYTTAQSSPLSLTTAGALRTDSSGSTQPISGTVTANQGTSPWVSNVSQFGGSAVVTGTGTSGAGIPRVTVSNDSNILATQSGTWNINNVSGTVSLPTGASTSANQTNGTQKTQIVDGAGTVIGAAQTIAGTNYLPVVLAASATPGAALVARSIQVAGSDGTNAQTLSTDATGKLNINTVAGTVTISGTVTANAGTNLNTSALALNTTVAALQVTQGSTTSGQSGTLIQGAVTTAAPTYTTAQTNPLSLTTAGALRTDASATTQPVSGTVTANAGTNLNTSALNLETTQTAFSAKFTSSTSTVTSVASSATNVTLLASNASRKGATFFNDSTKVAYIKLGTTASLTSYTIQVAALGFFIINNNPNYTGQIDALWSAANGNMRITELT